MNPPADLPSILVALGEAFARRSGIDPGDFWAYVYRRAAPPPEVRDAFVAAFFPRVPPESFLTPRADNDTLDTMDATTINQARRGRPLGSPKHPFVAMLKRKRLTIAEVAAAVKRAPSTVKAWYKDDDDDFRPIPREIAVTLSKKPYDVPLSAWRRIAD